MTRKRHWFGRTLGGAALAVATAAVACGDSEPADDDDCDDCAGAGAGGDTATGGGGGTGGGVGATGGVEETGGAGTSAGTSGRGTAGVSAGRGGTSAGGGSATGGTGGGTAGASDGTGGNGNAGRGGSGTAGTRSAAGTGGGGAGDGTGGTAGNAGTDGAAPLPTCVPPCTTAADCSLGSAAYDEDNYACTDGMCVYQGCKTDAECESVYPGWLCRDGTFYPTCTEPCATPDDCALTGAAYDADNYACIDGGCLYLGCNTDAECDATVAGYVCADYGTGLKNCTIACDALEDCVTEAAYADEDNVECRDDHRCWSTGCNDDAECATIGYICRVQAQ